MIRSHSTEEILCTWRYRNALHRHRRQHWTFQRPCCRWTQRQSPLRRFCNLFLLNRKSYIYQICMWCKAMDYCKYMYIYMCYVQTYKHKHVDLHEFLQSMAHAISSNHEVVLEGAVRSLGSSNPRLDGWVLDLADSGHDGCNFFFETIDLLHRVTWGCCQRSSERWTSHIQQTNHAGLWNLCLQDGQNWHLVKMILTDSGHLSAEEKFKLRANRFSCMLIVDS